MSRLPVTPTLGPTLRPPHQDPHPAPPACDPPHWNPHRDPPRQGPALGSCAHPQRTWCRMESGGRSQRNGAEGTEPKRWSRGVGAEVTPPAGFSAGTWRSLQQGKAELWTETRHVSGLGRHQRCAGDSAGPDLSCWLQPHRPGRARHSGVAPTGARHGTRGGPQGLPVPPEPFILLQTGWHSLRTRLGWECGALPAAG